MLVLLSLIYAGGIIIGIIVKGIIFDYSSARYSEDMILLGLEYFISVISLVLLVNTKETLPHKEQEWFESLIHLYVIHKSGILIYEHSFDKQKNKYSSESDLISGGIIGLIAVLNEIVKGHETLRAIDHGDKKLLFKYSPKKDIIFLLLIREDLITLRTKLDDFSYDFVRFFEEKLNKLDDFTGVKVSDWKKTELLIRRYFKRKYFI